MLLSGRGRAAAVLSVVLAAIGALPVGGCPAATAAEARKMAEDVLSKRLRVPPLPERMEWLNTAGPLDWRDLRGKFVLLDFWTYCCINCMHILPELKKLERAHPNYLVVIGVHSAKFETEKDSRNIAEAILRYNIEHPVVNDADMVLWSRFGVSAWPTLILIDPEGFVIWGTSGETTFERLDQVLRAALPHYRARGVVDETPLHFELEAYRTTATPLRFPGKVLAHEASGRLFIADSNHHRIVVADLEGKLQQVIGSGTAGQADGDFGSAQFNQPQGLALDGQVLYIADTENHLLRKADLQAGRVTTVAGVGRQARQPPVFRPAAPLKTPLNSPWDLWIDGRHLYIAMAGFHQIWRMHLDRNTIQPYAGNGREDIVDGPLLPERPYQLGASSFAQPSGLSSDGQWLYVADSEGSSIRAVPLDPRREVRTVVGTSHLPAARLFTFGDIDGPAGKARLQHPLGVAWYQGRLFVADTYNNKIKVIDPASGTVATLVGSGKPGRTDDPPAFDEPAGISAAAGKLFVADTNNHAIRVIRLADRTVSTLTIAGLAPPHAAGESPKPAPMPGTVEERVPPVVLRPEGGQVRLAVHLQLPEGMKVNAAAPWSYRIEPADGDSKPVVAEEALGKPRRIAQPAATVEIPVPLQAAQGRQTLRVTLTFFYCRDGAEGLCRMGTAAWRVPLEISESAEQSVATLRHTVR